MMLTRRATCGLARRHVTIATSRAGTRDTSRDTPNYTQSPDNKVHSTQASLLDYIERETVSQMALMWPPADRLSRSHWRLSVTWSKCGIVVVALETHVRPCSVQIWTIIFPESNTGRRVPSSAKTLFLVGSSSRIFRLHDLFSPVSEHFDRICYDSSVAVHSHYMICLVHSPSSLSTPLRIVSDVKQQDTTRKLTILAPFPSVEGYSQELLQRRIIPSSIWPFWPSVTVQIIFCWCTFSNWRHLQRLM